MKREKKKESRPEGRLSHYVTMKKRPNYSDETISQT